jgi:hypothetical protein
MAAWLLGPGDQRDGNDDCHSEIRGSRMSRSSWNFTTAIL